MMLARIFLLLSVLTMPLGMAPAATAQTETSAHAMPMGHCDQQRQSRHDMKGGLADCTMACSAALPAVETAREGPVLIASSPVRPIAAQVLRGLTPDTADPPPRRT
jgi:hypothetical protein